MNCSGKHGGMLVTGAVNGWPTDASICRPSTRLQQEITATIDDLANEDLTVISVSTAVAHPPT